MDRLRPWLITLTILSVLLLAGWFLPVQVPRSLDVPGRLLPVQEWLLTRTANGQLAATLRDHRTGAVVSYITTEIERGDALEFALAPAARARRHVDAGDTVGVLSSSEMQRRLAQLEGALQTSEALLQQTRAGEKTAVIDEAQQLLLQAQEQVVRQKQIVERQRQLAAQQLISDEAIEQAESQLRLYELNVAAARARLDALRTGGRPEDIALAQAQVRALRQELNALENRLARSTFVTPIAGPLAHTPSADTLLTVFDTSAFVVVMPVAWAARPQVETGQQVHVQVEGLNAPLAGTVTHIDPVVQQLQRRPFVLVTARLEVTPALLQPGLPVQCRLALPERSLRAVLQQFVHDLVAG